MGLDSIDTDLKGPDDIMNPFDFDKWWSMPVEPFSTDSTNSKENILYKMSTDIGLQNIKQSPSFRKTVSFSTISMVDSTGSTRNSTRTHLVHYIFVDDVYTHLEQISAKEAMDINSKRMSQKT